MNIMAFGTGIRCVLGEFNAGWWGVPLGTVSTRWRANVDAGARPVWGTVSVSKTQWEAR